MTEKQQFVHSQEEWLKALGEIQKMRSRLRKLGKILNIDQRKLTEGMSDLFRAELLAFSYAQARAEEGSEIVEWFWRWLYDAKKKDFPILKGKLTRWEKNPPLLTLPPFSWIYPPETEVIAAA